MLVQEPSLEQEEWGREVPPKDPTVWHRLTQNTWICKAVSSPALLKTKSSYIHRHPHPGLECSETDPHPQLAANAVLFLCGNVAGAYHKALMERALRATFREALSSLHSRRRLDTEKKHQVLLWWERGVT